MLRAVDPFKDFQCAAIELFGLLVFPLSFALSSDQRGQCGNVGCDVRMIGTKRFLADFDTG